MQRREGEFVPGFICEENKRLTFLIERPEIRGALVLQVYPGDSEGGTDDPHFIHYFIALILVKPVSFVLLPETGSNFSVLSL